VLQFRINRKKMIGRAKEDQNGKGGSEGHGSKAASFLGAEGALDLGSLL
jgi:hypothetical protein